MVFLNCFRIYTEYGWTFILNLFSSILCLWYPLGKILKIFIRQTCPVIIFILHLFWTSKWSKCIFLESNNNINHTSSSMWFQVYFLYSIFQLSHYSKNKLTKYIEMVLSLLHINAETDMQRRLSVGPRKQNMYGKED